MVSSHVPSSNQELTTRVRALSGYDDTPDELPQDDLMEVIGQAKTRLGNERNVTDFYADDGIAEAMVGATLIYAKASVENYSVDVWDLGDGSIDVSGAGDDAQVQFEQWADMVARGLATSDHADDSDAVWSNIVSNSYVG